MKRLRRRRSDRSDKVGLRAGSLFSLTLFRWAAKSLALMRAQITKCLVPWVYILSKYEKKIFDRNVNLLCSDTHPASDKMTAT